MIRSALLDSSSAHTILLTPKKCRILSFTGISGIGAMPSMPSTTSHAARTNMTTCNAKKACFSDYASQQPHSYEQV